MNNFFKISIIFLCINSNAGNLFNDNNELISNDFDAFLINFEKRIITMKQNGTDVELVKNETKRLEAIIEHHELNKENLTCYFGSESILTETHSCEDIKIDQNINPQIIFKEIKFIFN